MNILIVEDNSPLRTLLIETINGWGLNAYGAADGEEALNFFQSFSQDKIDVIICDIFLPNVSGPTFLYKIDKYLKNHKPNIIIISAYQSQHSFLENLGIKFDSYFGKPIDFIKLQNTLTELNNNQKITQ